VTACSAERALRNASNSVSALRRRPVVGAVIAVAFALAASPGCSQGEGNGTISGKLNVPECWTGAYNLVPSFLADEPYLNSTTLRLQSSSDFETFSDGLIILVDDRTKIRPDSSTGFAGKYGQALKVALPPSVTPPGTPVKPDPDPALVSMVLNLQQTCRTQTVTLDAVEEVTLPTDGSCDAKAIGGADPQQGCAAGASAAAGPGSGKSFVAFTAISNGKLDEETAVERLNAGCFDIYLADPRETDPGGLGPPPPCRGHLRGSFSFFFERGRPSQPFP
jgi:hypothetical protein